RTTRARTEHAFAEPFPHRRVGRAKTDHLQPCVRFPAHGFRAEAVGRDEALRSPGHATWHRRPPSTLVAERPDSPVVTITVQPSYVATARPRCSIGDEHASRVNRARQSMDFPRHWLSRTGCYSLPSHSPRADRSKAIVRYRPR